MMITPATPDDFTSWINLLKEVEDYFPGLDYQEYERFLHSAIQRNETFIARKNGKVLGAVAFSFAKREITFLAVHPEYRGLGIASELIASVISKFPIGTVVRVTTFREGDVKGEMARKFYESFGFLRGSLVMAFDYPCEILEYTVASQQNRTIA